MKKTDKKIDNAIRQALTEVCDIALDEVAGFQWLTHIVNYSTFPGSLNIVCVFACNSDLSAALREQKDIYLQALIQQKLSAVDVPIKDLARQIHFDSEEACAAEHGGRWHERFR